MLRIASITTGNITFIIVLPEVETTHASATMRKACLEPITFNPDGTIPQVEMTTQGIGGPISPLYRMDAARACLMSGNVMVAVRRPDNDIHNNTPGIL